MSTPQSAPRHVAVIMDGNGRWAARRGLPRTHGHDRGAEAVRVVVRAAGERGIQVLTLFGFSSENWRRPEDEVGDLMGLLGRFLSGELDELLRSRVRLRGIGDLDRLPDSVLTLLRAAEAATAHNDGLVLQLALSYGGRQEIVRAVQRLAEQVQAGALQPGAIEAHHIDACLDTAGFPDPDLVIRTSGELRLSNFLLWQVAYAALYVTDVLWPDFSAADLDDALAEYAKRQRRFGAIEPSASGGPAC